MINDTKMHWIWVGCVLEIGGLLLGIVSLTYVHRLTMTVFFAIGIPAILAGMLCYIIAVIRYMILKGAL